MDRWWPPDVFDLEAARARLDSPPLSADGPATEETGNPGGVTSGVLRAHG